MLPLRSHHVIGKETFVNLNIYLFIYIFIYIFFKYIYIYIFIYIFIYIYILYIYKSLKSQGKNVKTKDTSKEKYWICRREGRRGQEEKLLGSQKYKPLI